ncbi:MAG: non-canonical purine NTP pyrophosphatase [Phycisphaerae bacterium]|nr:non-canonical purine NTP pyrophosphatase [Phycisphaerae bacterium]
MRFVLATGNPHKLEELRAILAREGVADRVELLSLAEVPGGPFPEPAETGRTFEANAAIKARAYADATGLPCLADDSGLEVDALAGRPGVISSHYSTDGVETGLSRPERDRLNNERLLRDLDGVPPDQRTARFVCVMALAWPHSQARRHRPRAGPPDTPRFFRGAFEGRVGLRGDVPRGPHGFGYDPLFLVAPDFRLTSAELPPDEKNRLSHRAAAARSLCEFLHTLPGRP